MLEKFPHAPGYITTIVAPDHDYRSEPYNLPLADNTVLPGSGWTPMQAVFIDSADQRDCVYGVEFPVLDSNGNPALDKRGKPLVERAFGPAVIARRRRPFGRGDTTDLRNPLGTSTNQCTLYLVDVKRSGSGTGRLPDTIRIDIRLSSPTPVEVLARVDYDLTVGGCLGGIVANVGGPLGVRWEFWAHIEQDDNDPIGQVDVDLLVHLAHLDNGDYYLNPGQRSSIVNPPWF